jgi:anti-anti-sigma factor
VISSRTPEGWFGRCDVCGHESRVDPSSPTCDAPCPECGSLNWFDPPDEYVIPAEDIDGAVQVWEDAGRPTPVVLDFTGVRFVDSRHLGLILRLHTKLTPTGTRLRLRGLSADVRSVFDLTKLTAMFDCDE